MPDTLIFSADDWSLPQFKESLGDRLDLDPKSVVHVDYFDTFDWRLHNAGCLLTKERERGRTTLRWQTPFIPHPYTLPIDHEIQFAQDLPEGFLRSELLRLCGIRAVIVAGSARFARQTGRIMDADGNSVARLVIEESTPLDASDRAAGEPLRTISVHPVGSGDRTFKRVIRQLEKSGAAQPPHTNALKLAAEVRGRPPGGYEPKPRLSIRPDQTCGEVLRLILGSLRKTVITNVDGVIADIDVEFLHDFRVACRRARAALSQVKRVLPEPSAEYLEAELRWLGDATGSCRDLDVYLLEMDDYRRQLGDSERSIEDFERLLRRERSRSLRRVRGALQSKRFSRFIDEWGAAVESTSGDADGRNADRPISDVAGKKILKAYRRMVKRGSRLPDPPPADDLHRLRIDAKKLRYLLEFFGSLWPKKTTTRLVKELKQFQDILGGSNDMAVQQRHLAEFAEKLMAEGSTTAGTVFAMGKLADTMAARQEEFADAFAERFRLFAGDDSRKLYRKTFGGN